ncbi:MAG TPA: hypothetical protein VGI19_09350 [Candidatus Cybelea sp.]
MSNQLSRRSIIAVVAIVLALSFLGARRDADQCLNNKSIDWVKTLASDSKTADLAYVAGVDNVTIGQTGSTTLALMPLSFGAAAGVQTVLIYRLTTASPCAPPQLLGSFKTETTLVKVYFSGGTLHLVTLADQKEHSSRHPTDLLDTSYLFKDGKLAKVSSKQIKAK